MTYDYDLFVIGAGSGGVRAARISAGHGARVAICEESRVGGTCVIRGCVPKKLMVYASQMSQEYELSQSFGWQISKNQFSWANFVQAKDTEINRLNSIYLSLLKNTGVQLYQGKGQLVDEHHVCVNNITYSAEKILIAVGSEPSLPDIEGIEYAITSNEMFQLANLPEEICVVGGGYIAVEFAGILNGFGKKVTQIMRGDKMLREFDQESVNFLCHEMEKKGITLLFNTPVHEIKKSKEGKKLIKLETKDIETDAVLYATGRSPKISGLGLDKVGVHLEKKGAIKVNKDYQTNIDSIYAIGDVTDKMNLTPVATAEGHAFADNNFGGMSHYVDYTNIPTAIFSQPNFATVGMSEEVARKTYEVDVYTSSFRPMKYSLSTIQERSFYKLIVERKTQKILGCHIIGDSAGEIMQMAATAIKLGAKKIDFDQTIGIHPTSAEELVTMRNKRD